MVPLLFTRKEDWGGSYAQAGAGIVDTVMTNKANEQMQQVANQFNAQQAGIQRDWSAAQAQKQMDFNAAQAQTTRQFQTGEREAAQDYNTQMSNTQVQRRAADIRAAGFNPLLAASQLGGASSPTSTPMPGATASAGLPGGAAASGAASRNIPVLAESAQLNLASAQAANLRQNTKKQGAETDAQEYQNSLLAMETTPDMLMKRQQAMAAKYDLDYATASEVDAAVTVIRNGAKQSNFSASLTDFQQQMAGLSVQAQRATINTLIEMKNAVQSQQTQEAKNVQWTQSIPYLSKAIAIGQAMITPVASGAAAAKSLTSGALDVATMGAMP